MTDSKIVTRSKIISIIYQFKASKSYSDKTVQTVLDALIQIDDKELVIETILREINCQNTNFDIALTFVAQNISSEIFIRQIYDQLKSRGVPDIKKVFLVNVLRDMKVNINYDDAALYMAKPENMLALETELFVKLSHINPESQIDFLDFFFAISASDKVLLLQSIVEDYEGEELANILEPLLYVEPEADYIPDVINYIKESKSYTALIALENIIKNYPNSPYVQNAKKAHSELKLLGLREIKTKADILREPLQGSIPLGFWGSLVDGSDNFSIIFARQKQDGTLAAFFTAINLKFGINTCFGFDNIDIEEFKTILERFFRTSAMVELEEDFAIYLFQEGERLNRESGIKIPYEYICWKNYLADIFPNELDFKNYVEANLEKTEITQESFGKLIASDYFDCWFLKEGENTYYEEFLSKVVLTRDIKVIDVLIEEYIPKIFDDDFYDIKLTYQALFLHFAELEEYSKICNSLIYQYEYRHKLYKEILRTSVYQYFLQKAQSQQEATNIFAKRNNEQNVNFDEYIEMIEARWINLNES
ncbi:hypothetical protein IKA15_00390 [bacterium]|nr:hypothetical protein [bacterium]